MSHGLLAVPLPATRAAQHAVSPHVAVKVNTVGSWKLTLACIDSQ